MAIDTASTLLAMDALLVVAIVFALVLIKRSPPSIIAIDINVTSSAIDAFLLVAFKFVHVLSRKSPPSKMATDIISALPVAITTALVAMLVGVGFNPVLIRKSTGSEQAQAAVKDMPVVNVAISDGLGAMGESANFIELMEELQAEIALTATAEGIVRQNNILVEVVDGEDIPVKNMPTGVIKTFLVHSQQDLLDIWHLYKQDVTADNPPLGFVLFGVGVSKKLLDISRERLDKFATAQQQLTDAESALLEATQ
ncbi:hypothetical protein F5Y09DRAFT_348187 [Xylaria sp. FL1042]|nr:hypothetical protein F5Y09DRAFT_348187 [Xylaria sp. FL1042]